MRPLLKPGLRRVWRDGSTLQIGLTPGRSLLLNGVDAAANRFLTALDGGRDINELLGYADDLGVPGRQAASLLDMLARAGFLDDASYDPGPLRDLDAHDLSRLAPDLASMALGFLVPGGAVRAMGRRRAAVIAVYGCGRVGASVAHILAAAGVGCVVPCDTGRVRVGDSAPAGFRVGPAGIPHQAWATSASESARPADKTTPPAASSPPPRRQDLVRDLLRAISPTIRTALPANRQHPDLAILAPVGRWPQTVVEHLQAVGVPHLPAEIHETTATLGPFVQPGRSSCLHCRDLHRAARDPGWPRVLAQLVTDEPGIEGPCDTVLAAQLAVQTAMHALAFVEGDPPPSLNTSLDITLPYGDQHRCDRPPHAECGCGAAAAA